MKRDWIAAGRRPSGLCGAAILIAARSHNFNRTVREVARIVRVNDQTIRKRLYDFGGTPSSSLTISQFMEIDLEKEHDPPSFLVTKKKSKSKSDKNAVEMDEDELSEEDVPKGTAFDDEEDPGEFVYSSNDVTVLPVADVIARARMEEMFHSVPTAGLGDHLDDLVYLGQDGMEGNAEEEDVDALDLEGIDDEEIDKMLLNEEEVEAKTALWMTENGEYLREMEEKKRKQEEQRSLKEGKKKKQFRKKTKRFVAASSAGEATQKMLVEKKISNKINYDVLKDLMEDNNISNTGDELVPVQESPKLSSASLEHVQPHKEVDGTRDALGITRHYDAPGRLPSFLRKRSPKHNVSPRIPAKIAKEKEISLEVERAEISSRIGGELDTPGMEVVVESGPVPFLGEDIIESGGYYDEDEDTNVDGYYDDMAYPGDPLLHSDGEDDDEGY
jgi:hypothetical protein